MTSSAFQTASRHMAEERSRPWRMIGMAFFFLFCWWSVFDVAYMNGDDVAHFAGKLQSSLLPRLHSTWTPNRVVDTYGRSLLSGIFSFLFFSVNGVAQVGFLTLYKVVSASVFAIFAVWGLSYLLGRLPPVRGPALLRWTVASLMAVLFLQIFGWRNQVHFICYQVPSMLAFVLLMVTLDARRKEMEASRLSTFVLLSYLCAFSLESIAATILLFNAGLLIYEWARRREEKIRLTLYLKLILTNMGWSACALIVTVLFSERSRSAAPAENFVGMRALITPSVVLFGVALALLGAALLVFRRRCEQTQGRCLAGDLLFAVGLAAATWVVTLAVSVKAHTDYFSLTEYPWGDLMLTGKLAALYALGLVLARLASFQRNFRPAIALVLVIALSRLVHGTLERLEHDAMASVRVERVYAALSARPLGVLGPLGPLSFDALPGRVVTGLQLDGIAMQTRPFPTAASPAWFIEAYRETFRKFGGMETMPFFE